MWYAWAFAYTRRPVAVIIESFTCTFGIYICYLLICKICKICEWTMAIPQSLQTTTSLSWATNKQITQTSYSPWVVGRWVVPWCSTQLHLQYLFEALASLSSRAPSTTWLFYLRNNKLGSPCTGFIVGASYTPFVVRRWWPLLFLFNHFILLIFSSISRDLR